MDNKIKHLELIQGVINRMSSNAFIVKGWALTIIAAVTVIDKKSISEEYFYLPILLAIPFWVLDGFYLSKERQYINLYNDVRLIKDADIDFDLNTKKYNKGRNLFIVSMFSWISIVFYSMIVVSVLVYTKLLLNV